MVRSLLILLAGLLISFSLSAQSLTKKPKGSTSAYFGYWEYLPPSYSSNSNFPVIVYWHGVGVTGNGSSSQLDRVTNTGLPKLIKSGNWPVRNPQGQLPSSEFVVIAPQSNTGFPNFLLMDEFVDYIVDQYKVDADRVYFVGQSAGGITIFNYLNQYNKKVAAAIPIAGNGIQISSTACGFKHIPIWAFHGDKDGTVHPEGSIATVKAINNCKPAPETKSRVTIFPGVGHNSWDLTYNLKGMDRYSNQYDPFDISIYDWMLLHKRGEKSADPPPPPPNASPVVSAGSDKTIQLPTNQVNLNGSASDSDGSISSTSWSKVSGPAATIKSPGSLTTRIENLTQGTYTFRLTATDNEGAKSSDNVRVIVNPAPNQAPTVSAGSDVTIQLPVNTVELNGTASDGDGSIAATSWTKVSGPSATIVAASSLTTRIQNLKEGTYTFRLSVTDNDGASSSDEIRVMVNPAPNQAPTVSAGSDIGIQLPTNLVQLNGTASDGDGSIASVSWTKVSGPSASIVNSSALSTEVRNLVTGVYVFRLSVSDNDGASATDNVEVTVSPAANVNPVANAGQDASIQLPVNEIMLNGTASDADGNIASVKWTKVSGPSATIAFPGLLSTTVSNLSNGTYVFRLTVTDNDGAKDTDEVRITVIPAANVGPVARAGADQEIWLPANSVELQGTASDSDGSISSVSWTKISGAAATISKPGSLKTSVNGLSEGNYVFRLTVSDNEGETDSDEIRIRVNAAVNILPTQVTNQNYTETIRIKFTLDQPSEMTVKISDLDEKLIVSKEIAGELLPGEHVITLQVPEVQSGKILTINLYKGDSLWQSVPFSFQVLAN